MSIEQHVTNLEALSSKATDLNIQINECLFLQARSEHGEVSAVTIIDEIAKLHSALQDIESLRNREFILLKEKLKAR